MLMINVSQKIFSSCNYEIYYVYVDFTIANKLLTTFALVFRISDD